MTLIVLHVNNPEEGILYNAVQFVDPKADIYCVVTIAGNFTDKAALDQYFRELQIRAVEMGSRVCYVSNNGITGLVDPHGRILQESEPFVKTISYFDVPVVKSLDTIYPYIYDYLQPYIIGFFSLMVVESFFY